MANLSQTAADVKILSDGPIQNGTCGEALTAGQPVYQSGGKWFRGINTGVALNASISRIVIVGGAIDAPCVLALSGCQVDLGATLVVGETYILSATLGLIAPLADLASTNRVTILGVATAVNSFAFYPLASGVARA